MRMLESLQLSSIAFPAIGAGVAGFSYEDVAATMARVIEEEFERREISVEATIYLFDRFGRMREMDFIRFFEEFAARAPRIADHAVAIGHHKQIVEVSSIDLAAETQEDYKRRRLHNLRRLLADLEDQRNRLERQLIELLDARQSVDQKQVRIALQRNQDLRMQYLGELQSYSQADGAGAPASTPRLRPMTVFVSSTNKDLVDARAAVKDALSRSDLFFRGMEHFGAYADALPPASRIIEEVRKADAYIGIFGVRYGSIDTATGLSMTELEFREAETQKKPMLLYVVHSDAPVAVSDIESDPNSYAKLTVLKSHILKMHVPYLFKNIDDLARQAYSDLRRLKETSTHTSV